MNEYEAKQEAKRQRLAEAAERARRKAEASFNRSRQILDPIPPGQPILVGHHSERKHRRALEKSDRAMRAGIEASDRAAELQARADAVGRGGISSDDPDAVVKLREKLTKLEAERDLMKRFNAAWRKAGKPTAHDAAAWDPIREAVGCSERFLTRVRESWILCDYHDKPFPSYAFSNLGANIRRVRERIAYLMEHESARRAPPDVLHEGEGYAIETLPDANRIAVRFNAKPSRDVCQMLRGFGWRWSRTEGAWLRQLNNAGRASADAVHSRLRDADI